MRPIHPGLFDRAAELETVQANGATRCADDSALITPDLNERVAHLLHEHGWRMDGRRFDNRNVLQETL